VVQDRKSLNLVARPGVAVREVVMAKGHGRADYLLYVDQHAVGVIEAKPVGSTAEQAHAGCARAAIFQIQRQMGQCENDLTLDTHSLSERGPVALTRLVEPPRNPWRAAVLTTVHGIPHVRGSTEVHLQGPATGGGRA
jgi:hypothetical protein